MLRVFHRYKKSLMGFLVVCGCVLLMTGFGVSLRSMKAQRSIHPAISVDDVEISREEFNNERRGLIERYRAVFGKNYAEFEKSFLPGLNQQIIDKNVAGALLDKQAQQFNFYPPEGAAAKILQTEVFHGVYDRNRYLTLLHQLGMTAPEFEAKLAKEALRDEMSGLLQDVSFPTKMEIRSLIERDDTLYNVNYLELDPKQFASEVPNPDEAVLEKFFSERQTDYELPSRISYDFAVLNPADFKSLVEVTPEDIEVYYSENESKFMTPEQVKVSHIQFTYPKNSDPAAMADLKKKAEEVHEKALSGEKFESLALQYSDDITTKSVGGSLGLIGRGKMAKEFDDAVFKLKDGGISEVIETSYGFHIAKVDEYRPASPRKLEEVKGDIENELRMRDAPAYASAKAREYVELLAKGGIDFKKFCEEHKLQLQTSGGLVEKEKDPSPDLKGLTSKVMLSPDDKKQLVELGEKSVLVSVNDFKEPEIPSIAQLKDKLLEAYKAQEAKKVARRTADDLLVGLKSGDLKDLPSAAAAKKLTVKEQKDFGKAKPQGGIFADQDLQKAIFATSKELQPPTQVFTLNDKYYLAQVTGIKKPDAAAVEKKVDDYRSRASTTIAQSLVQSNINRLKAGAKIDIDPALLSQ